MNTNKTPTTEYALEYAIDAIERGKIILGNEALGWVLQREPDNRVAWLWMACTAPDEDAKRACYSRIDS
jgi:hypothetical protein